MSTTMEDSSLATALFGKSRRAILSLLYGHADEAFYLRQIARTAGVALGGVQREVKNLSDAGIIVRMERGRHVYYQANEHCPIFSELKSLMVKTSGVAGVLRAALAPFEDRIRIAFIFGSVARGDERRGSDVDVVVVGAITFAEVVSALGQTQNILNREVNPSVYPLSEFQQKLASGHHFLKSISKGPKAFLIGDERELAELAKERVVD